MGRCREDGKMFKRAQVKERLNVILEMKRLKRGRASVLSLVIWISSQPGSLAVGERSGGGTEIKSKNGKGGGCPFSSVWPLSHSNSGLAT